MSDQCPQCGVAGEFGYHDPDNGPMIWYCVEHRISKHYADKRRSVVPATQGPFEVLPRQSLEDEVQQVSQMIGEGRRMNEKVKRLSKDLDDLGLRLGRKLLGIRERVEAGEAGELCANDWWGWYDAAFPHVSRKHAERWMAIAAADNPDAAALEYRERDAAHQRAYRERQKQKQLAAPAASQGETEAALASVASDGGASEAIASEPKLVPTRPPPFPGDDVDESDQIEQMVAIFRGLTWNGRVLAIKRIDQLYRDWRQGLE